MKYLDLMKTFKNSYVFTTQDIKNIFKEINYAQFHSWVKEGKIIRLSDGKFIFPDKVSPDKNVDLMLIANELKNSYVSLESALGYYQIIPEAVFNITSITTERPGDINAVFGKFVYHKISPLLFNGYILIDSMIPGRKIKMATLEKALFDFIYLKRHKINGFDEIESFRFNIKEIEIDISVLEKYRKIISNFIKKQNIELLIRYIQNAKP